MKTRTFTIFALALAVVLASAAVAQDWKGRGRVQGQVLTKDGQPIEGATVTLYFGEPGHGPEAIKTKKNGKWGYLGLTGGNWNFVIEKDGYVAAEGQLPISEFKPASLVINLRPAEEAAAPLDEEAQEALSGIQKANGLLAQGQYAEARALYQAAIPHLDDESRPLVERGVAQTYLLEENWDAALSTLEQVLAALPEDLESLKMKAQALGHKGDVDAAIQTLDQLAAAGDVAALQLIINLLLDAGREEEAQAYMAKLPEGTKVDPNALLNTGIDKYNANELDSALSYFDRAAQENPDLPDVYYYRGLAYLAKGDVEAAKADFQKLLDLAPDHPKAGEAKEFLAAL
ncbi:MAG: tetratricopeptide repeat protein [Acidobacteria bacterium]|nr:MAG: tetratricopeptide repeat protein [Acidobacteriota bacterium]